MAAREGAEAVFTVMATGTASAAVTVEYAVTAGAGANPATPGAAYDPDCEGTNSCVDFVQQSGTLTFAAGEASKTIRVRLIDDNHPEPAEEGFTVELSNPTGSADVCPIGLRQHHRRNGD